MERDTEYFERRKKQREANERNMRLSYIVVALILLALVLGNILYLVCYHEFTIQGFLTDISGNLLGVLASFLVFDVVHDKISKDSYKDEVSEQILATLFSQDGIDALDDGTIRNFVASSVEHIARDDEAAELVNSFLDRYLDSPTNRRIRTDFDYHFYLGSLQTASYPEFKHCDEYYSVAENLAYHVKYLSKDAVKIKDKTVSIGFAFDNTNLDRFLRDTQTSEVGDPLKDCIFRESLDIDEEDIAFFIISSKERHKDLTTVVQRMFDIKVEIDQKKGTISDVSASKKGMVIKFNVDLDSTLMDHEVSIEFTMPKRWNTPIEVAIVDPTRSPNISLQYDRDSMQVEMYSFLDKGKSTSHDKTHVERMSRYIISLNGAWVYPISGVVWTINRKKTVVGA